MRNSHFALALLLIVSACAGSGDDLQSGNADYLSALCSTYSASADDIKTVDACHALEKLAGKNGDTAIALIRAKTNGKFLSLEQFHEVYDYVSANRVATTAIAKAYYRLDARDNGRKYAVQAIGWSFYDAKNAHDLIVILYRDADKSKYRAQERALRSRLVSDRDVAADMERLYPGVFDESLATRMKKLTRAEYYKMIDECARFGPECGDQLR